MDPITILGLVAGACSTLGFVPQVLKTWRTQSSQDLSPGMFGVLTAGALLWLVYGAVTWDVPLMAANGIGFSLQISMLALMTWQRRDRLTLRFLRVRHRQDNIDEAC